MCTDNKMQGYTGKGYVFVCMYTQRRDEMNHTPHTPHPQFPFSQVYLCFTPGVYLCKAGTLQAAN